jgi:hypothetical protein
LYVFEFYRILYIFLKFIQIPGIVTENEKNKKDVHSAEPAWHCWTGPLAKTQPSGPSLWPAKSFQEGGL